MAKYSAESASAVEMGGGTGFRLKSDGEKARVVFLYAGPESIDGWAVHRFTKPNGATTSIDCPRAFSDPMDKCPACKAKEQLYTRLFVRMLNLATNEVTVWDRAASFRKDLTGFMEYFNPLYGKVYEITRRGSGLNTTYSFQSLNDSGITEEQYKEYAEKADAFAETLLKPIESYEMVRNDYDAAVKEAEQNNVTVGGGQQAPGAWGAPQQGGWGQPQQAPQQNGWGQQAPAQQQAPQGAPQQAPAQGGWGQPPQGWGQAPQQ